MIRWLLIAFALPLAAQQTWQIDPPHSFVQFTVRHMMISTVHGQLGQPKGVVIYDPEHPERSSVDAEVDVTRIDTREPKRDSDLRGEEFFDIVKYPVAKFHSTKVEAEGPGKLKVAGDLTIRGITHPAVFEVEGPTAPVKNGAVTKAGASATAKISRKAYDILYNPLLEGGGAVVSDEVTIMIDMELIQKAPTASAR
jgi:polyisoprenoid-binding protein YceI